ncbi:MAG: SDR family oxidoreductase [Reichenbachiella sp.]
MSNLKITIEGKVALVTGSNRGIGKAIVAELISQGASKVYAGARDINKLNDLKEKYGDKIVPIQLDVTNESDIKAAVKTASDLDILINNAGILYVGGFFGESDIEAFDKQLAVNVHGLINVTKAFVTQLRIKAESAIVNVSSLAGLGNMPSIGNYSVTKAAVHSITQNFRAELVSDGVLVTGVYPGPIDTDMVKDFPMDKDSPENVAKAIVQGLIEGSEDIFPDQMSNQAGQGYMVDPKGIEKQFASFA